ncbi:MAG: hypothetical protein WAL89_17390 [Candidatus Sulfotelmatobacter sp.]|jgi:hypothetical protein
MNHEEELVKAFIMPTKRQRYLDFVSKPKARQKFLRELAHFKSLDPRYLLTIPPNKQHAKDIALILTQKGAPPSCWVTSEDSRLDGKEMPLAEALSDVVGRQMGTFLSCIPGRLAYFEGEDMGARWILERRP